MIQNDTELAVTLEQLARMYQALAALERDRARYSPDWFNVMAEGPLDEIRRMEADLWAYTGRARAEEEEASLWLAVKGPSVTWPGTPSTVLTEYVSKLRKGLQAATEWMQTGALSTRPTQALRRATDLRVVAFQPGSVRVGLELPEPSTPEIPGEVVEDALARYLAVVAWAADGGELSHLEDAVPDAGLRRVLLNEVKRLAPRLRGDVECVELAGRSAGRRALSLGRVVHARIDGALARAAAERVYTYVGDLREIDLDRLSFTLRNVDKLPHDVPCVFEAELLDTTIEALDRRVEVQGIRRVGGGRRGKPPRLLVTRLEIVDDSPDPET